MLGIDLGSAAGLSARALMDPTIPDLLPERWSRLRHHLRSRGLCGIIVGGRGELHRYGYLEYLAGPAPWRRDSYVLLGLHGTPILIAATDDAGRHGPDAVAPIKSGMAGALAQNICGLGMDSGPIGIAGENADLLEDLLGERTLVNVTSLLATMKLLKSDGDIANLRKVAALADVGMSVFADMVRPGCCMKAACDSVEHVLQAHGARDMIVRLGRGPRFEAPSLAGTIESGQLLCAYVEVMGPNGYWIELMRPIVVGAIGHQAERHLQACIETADRAVRLLQPGRRANELFEAATSSAETYGLRLDGGCGHGVGIDDQDSPRLVSDDQTILQSGMAVAVHPRLVDHETRLGLVIGETYLICPDGPQRFSNGDRAPIRVK